MTDRDWFTDAFGSAISDIRAKLIDEAWFGRRTPDRGGQAQSSDREPEPPAHNPWQLDRGIDR